MCMCVIPVAGNKPKTGGFNKTYQKGATEEAFRLSWYWRWKWWQLLRTRYAMSVMIIHTSCQPVVLTSDRSVTSRMFIKVMRTSCHNSACWEHPALDVLHAVLLIKLFLETDSCILEKWAPTFEHVDMTAFIVSSTKIGSTAVSWNTFF